MPPFLWPQTSHVAHDVSRPVSILGQLVYASTCRWVSLSMGQLVDATHTFWRLLPVFPPMFLLVILSVYLLFLIWVLTLEVISHLIVYTDL